MSIRFNCNIKVKHNFKGFNEIVKKLPQIVSESVEDILKNIQVEAIRLEKGHNENGILIEKIDTSTMEVKSRVYAKPEEFMSNGQSYLWFEYFGTGQYAEQDHIGKTAHFIESGYTEWFIPVNKVERSLNYPIITIKGSQFYIAHGAKGNHFMEDAEFKTRNENFEATKKKIETMLKEVCR